MSLNGALSIAAGGVSNIDKMLSVVSQNIANAGTPNYSAEVGTQESVTAGGVGMGVKSGLVTRTTDAALQAQTFQLASTVASLTTQQTALQAIDAVQGTPGQGNDLPSLLGKVGDAFSTLLNQPDSQAAQSAVVTAATTLTNAINTLSNAYTAQRTTAQTNLVSGVASLNQALSSIGSLSDQIMDLKATGKSTADLENQRDAAVSTVSGLMSVKTLETSNGDMLVIASSGLTLPTRAATGPFSVANSNVNPQSSYGQGTLPGVMLNGQDVTSRIQGGSLGGEITLRDSTLPTDQAELDEFSQSLASRFDAQGLTLFTDPTGAVPTSTGSPVQTGYVGFASTIQVNAAVVADPSLVRDGTTPIAGSPTGASAFTPNPPGGPAGFTDTINRILTFALGPQVQSGVPQPTPNTAGLGPDGTLQAPFGAPAALGDFASAMVASQAQGSATVTNQLTTEQAVQTSLAAKLSTATGVNMDSEMASVVALQNNYAINARIIAAVQAMWTQLVAAVAA